jgi:hypothetical protein
MGAVAHSLPGNALPELVIRVMPVLRVLRVRLAQTLKKADKNKI